MDDFEFSERVSRLLGLTVEHFQAIGEEVRIAFVTPYGKEYMGINHHTQLRMREWERQGHAIFYRTYGSSRRSTRGALSNLSNDLLDIPKVLRDVKAFGPDIIAARWHHPLPGFFGSLRKIAPVVLEVHADEYMERPTMGLAERLYLSALRRHELSQVAGIYFMNNASMTSPHFAKPLVPRALIGTGASANRRDAPPTGPRPVVGLSVADYQPWHGIQEFHDLAISLPEYDFEILCPAPAVAGVEQHMFGAGNIRVVPTDGPSDYLHKLECWTVAVGTLAMERAGRSSSTTLKVRDYVSHGVPTILPYWDDVLSPLVLSTTPDSGFELGIWAARSRPSLDPHILQPGRIREFVDVWSGRSLDGRAVDLVDLSRTERERLDFMRLILEGRENLC